MSVIFNILCRFCVLVGILLLYDCWTHIAMTPNSSSVFVLWSLCAGGFFYFSNQSAVPVMGFCAHPAASLRYWVAKSNHIALTRRLFSSFFPWHLHRFSRKQNSDIVFPTSLIDYLLSWRERFSSAGINYWFELILHKFLKTSTRNRFQKRFSISTYCTFRWEDIIKVWLAISIIMPCSAARESQLTKVRIFVPWKLSWHVFWTIMRVCQKRVKKTCQAPATDFWHVFLPRFCLP